jgi:hypothetical protein
MCAAMWIEQHERSTATTRRTSVTIDDERTSVTVTTNKEMEGDQSSRATSIFEPVSRRVY